MHKANENADNVDSNQLNSLIELSKKCQKNCFIICGGYRSRTDDPLRARQML